MKNLEKMSLREVRAECGRHRKTLNRIRRGEDGCLAANYQWIAREALQLEEALDEEGTASSVHQRTGRVRTD